MKLNRLAIIGIGICTGITGILLFIAYVPGFSPSGSERLRKSRLIHLVPLVAATQLITAVAWLKMTSKEEEDEDA